MDGQQKSPKRKKRHSERSAERISETNRESNSSRHRNITNEQSVETEILHVDNNISYRKWTKEKDDLLASGVHIREGRWSLREDEQLRNNWEKFFKENPFNDDPWVLFHRRHFDKEKRRLISEFIHQTQMYLKLAYGIMRPMYHVYRRVVRLFDDDNYKGRFSEEELSELNRLRETYGNKWSKIGVLMDRSGKACFDRFRVENAGRVTGAWSDEEQERLMVAIKEEIGEENLYKLYYGVPWSKVAKKVKTRTSQQCRNHWSLLLSRMIEQDGSVLKPLPRLCAKDKIKLLQEICKLNVRDESDIDWTHLSNYFPNSSPQFIRNCWYHLKAKVPNFRSKHLDDILDFLIIDHIPKLQDKEKPD